MIYFNLLSGYKLSTANSTDRAIQDLKGPKTHHLPDLKVHSLDSQGSSRLHPDTFGQAKAVIKTKARPSKTLNLGETKNSRSQTQHHRS